MGLVCSSVRLSTAGS